MSFDLAPEYLELQASVRKLAQDKIKPRARADRHRRHLSPGRVRGVPRRRAPRPGDPGGLRRWRGRDPRPHARDRRGRQVLQHRRADVVAHAAAHRAGPDRGQRGTEAAVHPAGRHRRAARRLRALGTAGRQRCCRDAHQGRARRRRLGAQRHEVLDVGRRAGRLVLRVRQDRSRRLPQARRHLVLHRRSHRAGRLRRSHRRQDGCARRRHRRAHPRRRARARRERCRRGRRLPARDARAQLDAADRRGARHRARPKAR